MSSNFNMSKKTRPQQIDALDKWLDENGYYSDLYSMPVGRHGKKVNGEFVGRRLNEAYDMGACCDDEPIIN